MAAQLTLPPAPPGVVVTFTDPPRSHGYRDAASAPAADMTLVIRRRSLFGLVSLALSLVLALGTFVFLGRQLGELALVLSLAWSPLVYVSLTRLVNSVTVTAGRTIAVAEGPLPFRGASSHALAEIVGFSVVHEGRRRRRGTFVVRAKMRDGRFERVVAGLDDENVAAFVANALGAHAEATSAEPPARGA